MAGPPCRQQIDLPARPAAPAQPPPTGQRRRGPGPGSSSGRRRLHKLLPPTRGREAPPGAAGSAAVQTPCTAGRAPAQQRAASTGTATGFVLADGRELLRLEQRERIEQAMPSAHGWFHELMPGRQHPPPLTVSTSVGELPTARKDSRARWMCSADPDAWPCSAHATACGAQRPPPGTRGSQPVAECSGQHLLGTPLVTDTMQGKLPTWQMCSRAVPGSRPRSRPSARVGSPCEYKSTRFSRASSTTPTSGGSTCRMHVGSKQKACGLCRRRP